MVQNFSKDVEAFVKLIGEDPLKHQWPQEGSPLDRTIKIQSKSNYQHLIRELLEPIPEEVVSSDTNAHTQ